MPSHDTFERVFSKLEPRALQCCCLAWLRAITDVLGMGHIAIDGKTLCGSAGSKWGALHLVSAWATEANLTLGQVAVDGKSNEITAIPQLLKLLDLHGALVTIDAMGCQKEIAKTIIARGGDYVLPVKGNQKHLLEDVQATVERALNEEIPAFGIAAQYHGTRTRSPGKPLLCCSSICEGNPRSPVLAQIDYRGHVLHGVYHQGPHNCRGAVFHR